MTLATLDTLGALITATFTVANDDSRARFFKAATPPSGVTPGTLSRQWLASLYAIVLAPLIPARQK
jgi:hypothetical protein